MPTLSSKLNKVFEAQSNGVFDNEQDKVIQSELDSKSERHKRIINQIDEEYELCWRFMKNKIAENLKRLKLYNNQKRDKERVGDPLLFTIHQTILASLYDDKLAIEFGGREEGDEEMAENLNYLAEFDYDDMQKDILDYEWIWDTTAFGRGLVLFNEFDSETKTPIPEVIDSLTWIRDPRAVSVNGNRLGHNGLRFGGREIRKTKYEMKESGNYFNLDKLKKSGESSSNSLIQEARQSRREAQGLENIFSLESSLTENYEYSLLQWFTHIDGKKYIVELSNDRSLIVRLTPVNDKRFPIIDRSCFPISHDWDGVNIFDILEDKQRFRAVLLNVFGDSAKADAYPMYLFDKNKLKKEIDKSFAFNKWLPVDGEIGNAAMPLQKASPGQQVQFILEFLDQSAQKALATPELQSGKVTSERRTATELELVASKVDTRYSLTARVFGWSEKMFWNQWYKIYDRDFDKDIHKKVIRLAGAFGPQWREITRDSIITTNPLGPDIKIESKNISEARKLRNYNLVQNYIMSVVQSPVDKDMLYGLRKLGKLIMPKDEVERLLPLTIDERKAKEENLKLNEDENVKILAEEDHNVHLRMHSMAKDTNAAKSHIKAHEMALMIAKAMPEMFPQLMPPQMQQEMQKEKMGQSGQVSQSAPEGAGQMM